MISRDVLEAKAQAEFASAKGTVIEAYAIHGFSPDSDDPEFIELNPPAKFRVESIDISGSEWLDIDWHGTLVEPHPSLNGWDSIWVQAGSYHPDGRTELPDWTK